MSAQSELRSPARSDSPILPVPRIAILMPQAYESGVVSRQQIHAREPGPLAVGLEQGVGLLGLDAPAPERRGELDEPEIAREPALVAAEPLEADDAGRPRARARARARAAGRRPRSGRAFSASRSSDAAEPDERRAAARAEPEAGAARRARSAPRSAAVGARVEPAELAASRRGRRRARSRGPGSR